MCPGNGFFPEGIECSSTFYYCDDGEAYQQVSTSENLKIPVSMNKFARNAQERQFLTLLKQCAVMLRMLAVTVCTNYLKNCNRVRAKIRLGPFAINLFSALVSCFNCPDKGFYPTRDECSQIYYYCEEAGGTPYQLVIF